MYEEHHQQQDVGIPSALPAGLVRTRRTKDFTRDTVPAALLKAHTTRAGTWGLLRVTKGRVRYRLDSPPFTEVVAAAGDAVVIVPAAPHHIELMDADSTFHVEFYGADTAAPNASEISGKGAADGA